MRQCGWHHDTEKSYVMRLPLLLGKSLQSGILFRKVSRAVIAKPAELVFVINEIIQKKM